MKIIGVLISDIVHDLIIVGSDPAGYTAATYAARADLKPVMFKGIEFGGLLMTTTDMKSCLGFSEGIMGPELMDQMRAQAERFGADLHMEIVDRMDPTGDIKSVWVDEEEHKAHTVILATSAVPRYIGAPDEQALPGRGVSACATCDGFFFRDHDIAVIGDGNSATEETTFLTKFARSATTAHRRGEFRASEIMVERTQNNDKIRLATNKVVSQVLGEDEGSVAGLELEDTVTGEKSVLDVIAMFAAIGHGPRSQMVRNQLDCDESGYIQVTAPSIQTSLKGVFAVGDVVDSHYQQAITAAGFGCKAALDAEHYLETAARQLTPAQS